MKAIVCLQHPHSPVKLYNLYQADELFSFLPKLPLLGCWLGILHPKTRDLQIKMLKKNNVVTETKYTIMGYWMKNVRNATSCFGSKFHGFHILAFKLASRIYKIPKDVQLRSD